MKLDAAALWDRVDRKAAEAMVDRALEAALGDELLRLRLLARYASWNGFFGSSVASLAGLIGRARGLFADPSEPVTAVADRSVLVGSYFFDAARDEFDDRDTPHRDTHRCLAQALLRGLIDAAHDPRAKDPSFLAEWLREPMWLVALNARVGIGYGHGSRGDAPAVFRAMGYHLGSELLADREFSLIDRMMRARCPELVARLEGTAVRIAGQQHVPYAWIRIHSGHGGSVEADHFEWATRGVRAAFDYTRTADHAPLSEQLFLGFQDFARDHAEFFTRVGAA